LIDVVGSFTEASLFRGDLALESIFLEACGGEDRVLERVNDDPDFDVSAPSPVFEISFFTTMFPGTGF
jgi:hypothetical protein